MIGSLLALLLAWVPARAQEGYGAKGIFPIYESPPQWAVFDKKPVKTDSPLNMGRRFLVVGSEGAELFTVRKTSGTYGGACRSHKPAKLRAALLVGPRSQVGRPIIGISVPDSFSLRGSRAAYAALKSDVGEGAYGRLLEPIRAAVVQDFKAGRFKLKTDDPAAESFSAEPKTDSVQTKIDFGSELTVKGLGRPYLFVEESQIGAASRRCLRLAIEDKLIGDCAEMPRTLMAETALLQFVAYDPSGEGSPFVMAFTKSTPMWGDERWGFVVRASGPRLFLVDAMDPRCRAGF